MLKTVIVMRYKNILLFIFTFFIAGQIFAQKKTTSVKGYYRKDGTYVRPHTRTYNAGSSSYSSGSYSSTYVNKDTAENIPLTGLQMEALTKTEYQTTTANSKYQKGVKISPSTLQIDGEPEYQGATIISDTIKAKQEIRNNSLVIYISVLRYNGKAIDICPITRNYSGDWDFNKVQHRFIKTAITAEEALQLVADYEWIISGEELKKDFSYDYFSSKGFPKYLTKTIEVMKLK